jgi:6-hydroxytryprostatin B O-methyltransferase
MVSSLREYANSIIEAVEVIDSYCKSEGIPYPSFDTQAPSVTIPTSAPLTVQDARQKLIASAIRVQQLATEPANYLPSLAIHVCVPLFFYLLAVFLGPVAELS